MSDEAPKFSIITTCKNRLDHLKTSLPSFVAQKNCEVIVVDYDCPQQTEKWVNDNYPFVKVAKINNRELFNLSAARNFGARISIGQYLIFIDADVIISEDMSFEKLKSLEGDVFYRYVGPVFALIGEVLVPRTAFTLIEGYDEAFTAWGGEDGDFYERLENLGLKSLPFPEGVFKSIHHDDSKRSFQGYLKADLLEIDDLYRAIKIDIQNIYSKSLNLHERSEIMKQILRMYSDNKNKRSFKILIKVQTPRDAKYGSKFIRNLEYIVGD